MTDQCALSLDQLRTVSDSTSMQMANLPSAIHRLRAVVCVVALYTRASSETFQTLGSRYTDASSLFVTWVQHSPCTMRVV
jgi:hypothetical protein